MSEKTLKEVALLERVGELTCSYEDRIADLRVELTNVSNERDELRKDQSRLLVEIAKLQEANEPDTIEGEVVQEEGQ